MLGLRGVKTSFLAVVLGVASFHSVEAATVSITGVDTTRGQIFDIALNGVQSPEFVGVIQGVSGSSLLNTLFCIDVFTPITIDTYTATLFAPRTARHEDRVAWLLNAELANITNPDFGSALQLAIWDIIHDNGDGLSSGAVQSFVNASDPKQTPAGVIALANTFLSESVGKSSLNATIYTLNQVSSGVAAQTLIGVPGVVPPVPPPPASTPEPATWLLSGAAFSCLVLVKGKLARR